MRAIHAALLLASVFVATGRSAPAPLPREPRHAPSPQRVLDRLRAEGLDVTGVKHVSGSQWAVQEWAAAPHAEESNVIIVTAVTHTIFAPGDPTDKLREALRKKK